jgi:hypothetical protein
LNAQLPCFPPPQACPLRDMACCPFCITPELRFGADLSISLRLARRPHALDENRCVGQDPSTMLQETAYHFYDEDANQKLRKTSTRDFPLAHVARASTVASQKTLDDKSSFSILQQCLKTSESHKMASPSFQG